MMLVWAMGIREGMLGVEDCVRAWQALVRPVLEYGAIVWGDVKWEQAERVQREMGKMILRCSSKMANEVVLGELGWWKLNSGGDVDAEEKTRLSDTQLLGENSGGDVTVTSCVSCLSHESLTI